MDYFKPISNRKLASTGSANKIVSDPMSNLIAELLHAVTKTHMIHLKITSYSAHKALNSFYDELSEYVDSVAEQYQGVTGKLLEYPTMEVAPINSLEEALEYLQTLYSKINAYQQNCMYSEISNTLDEIKSLINSTVYKLNFLK